MLATMRQTAELADLFRRQGIQESFRKGDIIMKPGDTPPGVFYIYEGLVKVFTYTHFSEENLVIIRDAQAVFPFVWAITGLERKMGYRAMTATTTWRISRQEFIRHLQTNHESMTSLLDMSIELYRLQTDRVLNLEYRTVRERLISFLLTMGQRFGEQTSHGMLIAIPFTRQDIANSVNATRETVSRELATLQRLGLIETRRDGITIKNQQNMVRYLQPKSPVVKPTSSSE